VLFPIPSDFILSLLDDSLQMRKGSFGKPLEFRQRNDRLDPELGLSLRRPHMDMILASSREKKKNL
jgi:hypothetical protein